MWTLLLACVASGPEVPDDGDRPGDTAHDTDDADDTGAPDVAACAPDHALLPADAEVVEAVSVPEWSYTAWQLDLWLQAQGLGWLTPMAHDVSTWRVRYATQDRGERVEATALVSVPVLAGEAPTGTVLWLHGTSGFEDGCAPSAGAPEGLAPAIVSAARGYVAVAPDYLGLAAFGNPAPDPHPWIVGEPTGVVALDALAAVDAWLPTTSLGARVDRDRIVYWGWSEGGYTALMADRYAPSYAPELAPVGVVAAVPPVDVVGQIAAGTATFGAASKAGALILYLHAAWYGLDGLDAAVQPDVLAALPDQIAASCGSWPAVDDATAVSDLYTDAFVAALAARDPVDPWTCVLARSSLPSAVVPYEGHAPVLLVTGTADTLVPAAPVEAAIPELCAEGYTLEHISCVGLEHGDAPVFTLQRQIAWIDARMSGTAVEGGCGVAEPETCGG